LKIKWRHFAPLRLGEKLALSFRRRFSQRRKDAEVAKGSLSAMVAPRSKASEFFWNFRLSLFASDSSLR
jgi:hypothetical protein